MHRYGRIVVDKDGRTSNPNVYAVGDVTGTGLASAAAHSARSVADVMWVGHIHKSMFDHIGTCTSRCLCIDRHIWILYGDSDIHIALAAAHFARSVADDMWVDYIYVHVHTYALRQIQVTGDRVTWNMRHAKGWRCSRRDCVCNHLHWCFLVHICHTSGKHARNVSSKLADMTFHTCRSSCIL